MTDNAVEARQEPEMAADDDEISLLDLAIVLAKHKRRVIGLPIVVAILAVIVSLLLPNIYTGTTKILPPQGGESTAAAMLGQLGGLAGVAGGLAGIKNPADMYIGMLKSRTVADDLIKRFALLKVYKAKYQSVARNSLAANSNIAAGKDGIITISVDDKDPQRAADIANAYVDELFKLTKVLAVTEASQRRLFFQNQFNQAKDELAKSELAARQAIEKGGLANVDVQGQTMITTTARLRAEITVKEVQIGAMKGFAADRNPDLLRAQQELTSLKNELAKIEGAVGNHDLAGSDVAGVENVRLLRDLKYYETVYEMLAKQLALAKIDEAKDPSIVQVMDKAVVPDLKSKPKRALIVVLSTLVALFVAILWAFLSEAMENARKDPETAPRLQAFRRYLSWRS